MMKIQKHPSPCKHLQRPLQSSKTPTWLIFVGMMVVTNCIYVMNTQQLVREAHVTSRSSRSGSAISKASAPAAASPILPSSPKCASADRARMVMLMSVLHNDDDKLHRQYWIAVANRRAYALQHNVPLYLISGRLATDQHPVWEKLIALQAVFKHSCADWVWMNDADAYIMNLNIPLMDLANNPMEHKHPKQLCNTSTPDMIGAGACLSFLNAGSLLLRNTQWTNQFMSDTWHARFAEPLYWREQAAMLHLYTVGDNKQHVCIVQQRAINAFPNVTDCHDGTGTFKEGDFIVHFAGPQRKGAISTANSTWLNAVPLMPSHTADTAAHAPIFTVTAFTPGAQQAAQAQQVHVSMQSQAYGHNSSEPTEFDVSIQPQAEGFSNWGWPVLPPLSQHGNEDLQQQAMRERKQHLQELHRKLR